MGIEGQESVADEGENVRRIPVSRTLVIGGRGAGWKIECVGRGLEHDA